MQQIADWLEKLGLGQYAQRFAENGIDPSILRYLTDQDQTERQCIKLLQGAKVADIPIEQLTKFELAINLNTAKALGLTIPESFLVRADHIVE